MFYDIFLQLCAEKGVKPTPAALAIGVSSAAAAKWKKGATPSGDTLQKIAEYFGVSVDYLLGNDETSPAAVTEDDELYKYLEELKNRKEMRMLFKLASGATKEDVEKAVAIIEALSR